MKPGIHRGVSMAEYLALDAVSASLLHRFQPTALHARHYMTQPREDTTALMVGEAAHYAILEPDLFDARYAVIPQFGRSNADKAAKADWISAHPSIVALKQDEYDAAIGISKAVRAHAEASRYLYGRGQNEVTLVWNNDLVLCKARPDRIADVDGWTFVPDIKTCRNADAKWFSKAVHDYGYHQKAAWYLDALNAFAPRERRFLFIAVESAAPHAVAIYELTDDALAQGRDENAAALATYREAASTGIWPGYPTGIQYLDLPKYAQAARS